jgi:hypothetical protein
MNLGSVQMIGVSFITASVSHVTYRSSKSTMNNSKDLALPVSSLFDSVSYDETANSWVFLFAENICVQVAGFWRALKTTKLF